jgi:hypothetical protein
MEGEEFDYFFEHGEFMPESERILRTLFGLCFVPRDVDGCSVIS